MLTDRQASSWASENRYAQHVAQWVGKVTVQGVSNQWNGMWTGM